VWHNSLKKLDVYIHVRVKKLDVCIHVRVWTLPMLMMKLLALSANPTKSSNPVCDVYKI
jgi:hypothetical protein